MNPEIALWLPALMLAALGALLFLGLPVAVVLIAVAFIFAGIGLLTGAVRTTDIGAVFYRVYGTLSDRDEILYAAVPLLIFMGAILHECGLAEDLLAGFEWLFGRRRGGTAAATLAAGALQAPAAGIVGASVAALALYALPALRRQGVRASDAAGLVAAAGTLGVVAPPGIMLFFIADATSVQVPALFLAMLEPLAVLLALYFCYATLRAAGSSHADSGGPKATLAGTLVPAVLLIGVVAAVALGLATLSEAASLATTCAAAAGAFRSRLTWAALDRAIRSTALLTSMVFLIFIGASTFALVFRLLGGAQMIGSVIHAVGGHGMGTLWASVALIFILGMFLDWLEIVVITLPVLASVLQADGGVGATFASAQLAGCWIGALFALSLQTSFLTPPFGYALLLVHGATSGAIAMAEIWRGALPYVALQLLALGLVAAIPELATWLPAQLLDLSIPKGPKFNE